jgi:hypothetical protein
MPEGFYEGSSRKELPAPMEPLSLDDAPQLPPKREAPLEPVASKNTPQTSTLLLAAKSLGLTLVVMAAIYAAYWFWIKPRWVRFSPPNGDCSVLMPGTPKQEDILATGFANLGGKRFIVSWRSSTKKTDDRSSGDNAEVSIGWIDLDSQRLPGVQFDQIAIPAREREAQRLEGKSKGEVPVIFSAKGKKYDASECLIESENGITVLRLYLQQGDPRRRMYILEAKAPDLDRKEEWVVNFFNSFEPL